MRRALAFCLFFLCLFGAARGEVVNGGRYRISFSGKVQPDLLPRHSSRPIAVGVRGQVTPLSVTDRPS